MKKLVIKRKDLKNNIKLIRKVINCNGKDDTGNHTKIIAVVKGNGMGLGLIPYTKFLEGQGIDYFAVATIDEAIELRNSGIEKEILLMTPIVSKKEICSLVDKKIILTISSIEQIKIIEEIAENIKEKVKCHIKIDTGFGRYGFLYNDLEKILEVFKCKEIEITGMYTHFSKPIDEKYTLQQFERFMDVIKFLKENGKNPGMLHCAASTAVLKYPMMHLNAVRIGSLFQGRTLVNLDGLIKIGEFKSNIQEIKLLPKGYNISYGRMYKTRRITKIAVVPVGYIDGLNIRKDRDIFSLKENILSVGIEIKKFFRDNSIKVLINGKKYNIIGRIGMYHCVVDITKDDSIKIDDEVTFDISPLHVNSVIRREYV